MSANAQQRKLAAIMFTDMVGYSALSQHDDKLALELLEEHRRLLRELFGRFNGTEIKTIGDGFLVEFHSALEAAQCAIEIQRTLAKRNADAPADGQIQVRIGIHIGDVVHRGGDVFGDGVNIASRIEALAGAGGICVSMDVERQIRSALEARFEKLAPTELKNISVPMDLFRIVLPWERQKPLPSKSEIRNRKSEITKTLPRVALAVAVFGAAILAYQLFRRAAPFSMQGGAPATPNTQGPAAARPSIPQKSIAVLPLLNESGDPKDEYFSDGLSEELIAALAQISGLKVIGRSSSFRFKDRNEDPKKIAEKLGVSTLLEGTVRKQGDRVRIVAELVNAADGIELWTRTFDRELQDIFAVQQEIARAVAQSLKVTLLGSEDKSAQMATNNVEAHNAYLQGHFYFLLRNVDGYRKAVTYFDQAIQLDPNYALAYAERSEAWTLIGDLTGDRQTAWPKARSDAEKAAAIAPALAEAHSALGWVRFFVDWRFVDGLRELKRAKELSPANPTANDLLARAIVYLGRFDDAERQAREAVELDPLSVSPQFNLGRVLFYEGKLDEAEAVGRRVVELQPTASSSHRWQVFVAVQRGDGETALREAQLEPDDGFRRFELALAYHVRGEREAADAALADLVGHGREGLAYQIAEAYAMRGEANKAFEWLQISFDNHDGGTLSLGVDPLLRGLRDDPRYNKLLVKLGLPAAR
jgi:adenylate cyclase